MLQRFRIFLLPLLTIGFCGSSLQAAGAFLTFHPGSVTVSGSSGGPAVTQTVSLLNTGSAATDWTLGLDRTAPWLTASPPSGKALAAGGSVTITLTANPADLKPNSLPGYQANITPQANGMGTTLAVTFNVSGTSIEVTPNPISLSIVAGTQQTFANVAQINGTGNISIAVTTGTWLSVIASGQPPAPITLIVDATTLTPSSTPYQGSLLIQCASSTPCIPQNVPVILTVYLQLTEKCAPATGPAQVGVAYSTTCTASGGNNSYLWSIGAGSLPSGVSLSSATGSTIQISGTPTSAGPYSYAIAVTDRSLHPLSSSQTFNGTIAPQAASMLSVSPSSLSFGSYTVGDKVPAAQSISLNSANPASGLAFTSTTGMDCGWLTLSPAAGTTPATLAVSVNSANATPGSHSCLITFNASGVSPSPVVTATVTIASSNTPVISAVVNAAGFNPAGPISTGAWVAVFGDNLAPTGDSRQWNTSTEIVNGEFPTSLDGTSVTVNGRHAAVEFISSTQVNIQLPDDTAVGPVQVVISTTAGGASAPYTSNYAQFAPGLFLATNSYLAVQHADGSYVGGYAGATPAKPDEVITLWGTGFGPARPPVPAGQTFAGASKLVNDVTVTIGGQPAIVDFAGVVGAGLVQINVHVPSSVNDGDAAVSATVGGVSTQAVGNLITVHN